MKMAYNGIVMGEVADDLEIALYSNYDMQLITDADVMAGLKLMHFGKPCSILGDADHLTTEEENQIETAKNYVASVV